MADDFSFDIVANNRASGPTDDAAKSIQHLSAALDEATKAFNRYGQASKSASQTTNSVGNVPRGFQTEGARYMEAQVKAADAAKRATEDMYRSLASTRYALYDVSSTWGAISAATLGAAVVTETVAIEYERLLAQVQRTSGAVGTGFTKLSKDLIDLSTNIPTTFEDITDIAALGGQLGIAASGISEFTEVTAKLTATTNLSAEAAGTALGRFQALLGVPTEQFSNLASSILKVGVNSVATETQIVNIATQISSMGSFAGLSADQVIGLSGALASVGAQPEISRGTITRLFANISKAVAEGGDSLERFAAISGRSAADFQAAWGTTAFAGVFQDFLRGIESTGGDAVAVLNSLGVESVRDVPLLMRLAGAGDVVANAFSDAASGYSENSELTEQYGIVAATTAAKLQELANTVKAIMAAAGNSKELGVLVDLLQFLADGLREVVESPIGGFLTAVALAATATVGVFAAYRAGLALMQASALGLIQVQRAMATSTVLSNVSWRTLTKTLLTGRAVVDGTATSVSNLARAQSASVAATQAQTAAQGALAASASKASTALGALGKAGRFAGWIGVAIGGIQLLGGLLEGIENSFKSASQKAEDYFGGFDGLAAAIKADTDEYKKTGQALQVINTTVEKSTKTLNPYVTELEEAAGAQSSLRDSTSDTTTTIEDQIVAIGQHTRALLAQKLADNDDFVQLWINNGEAIKAAGFNLDEYFTALASGSSKEYLQPIIDQLHETAEANIIASDVTRIVPSYNEVGGAALLAAGALEVLQGRGDGVQDALGEITAKGEVSAAALRAMGQATGDAGDGFDDLGDKAAEAIKQLRGLASASTDAVNAASDMQNSLSGLGESLVENGTSFDVFSEAGRANIAALDQVIQAAVTSSNGNATALAENLSGILQALSTYGVDVAGQLSYVMDLINAATGAGGLATSFTNIQNSANSAGAAMRTGFASGVDRARKSISSTKKEVRTLSDYISDLAGVISSAFDFRFGYDISVDDATDALAALQQSAQDAKDRVTDALDSIADAAGNIDDAFDAFEDAGQKIQDIRIDLQELDATIRGLSADQNVLKYQLGVAVEYGDTLRAQTISAEIAENEAKLAGAQNDRRKKLTDLTRAQEDYTDANKNITKAQRDYQTALDELADAQADQTRTLTGSSDSARNQRELVLDLVQAYQEQITALANTGASSDEVKRKVRELQSDFQRQLTQLGYNRSEIGKYAAAFEDVTTAINRVPKNLTITANTSPAQRAIDEFLAKNTGGRGASQTINSNIVSHFDDTAMKKAARGAEIQAQIDRLNAYLGRSNLSIETRISTSATITSLARLLSSGNYAGGGFTGRGGKFDAAGIVHRGEYVIPKEYVNQNTGLPYANALGAIMNGYASGGYVRPAPSVKMPQTLVVELSPTDRALLAANGNVVLTVDGKVLADAVNGSNVQGNRRSSR